VTPHEAAALRAIGSEYEALVTYTGAGLASQPVPAIKSITESEPIQGLNGRGQRTSFEIRRDELLERPRNGNRIVEADLTDWKVIDVNEREDIDAFVLFAEKAVA